jgi:hypothetical protein
MNRVSRNLGSRAPGSILAHLPSSPSHTIHTTFSTCVSCTAHVVCYYSCFVQETHPGVARAARARRDSASLGPPVLQQGTTVMTLPQRLLICNATWSSPFVLQLRPRDIHRVDPVLSLSPRIWGSDNSIKAYPAGREPWKHRPRISRVYEGRCRALYSVCANVLDARTSSDGTRSSAERMPDRI